MVKRLAQISTNCSLKIKEYNITIEKKKSVSKTTSLLFLDTHHNAVILRETKSSRRIYNFFCFHLMLPFFLREKKSVKNNVLLTQWIPAFAGMTMLLLKKEKECVKNNVPLTHNYFWVNSSVPLTQILLVVIVGLDPTIHFKKQGL